MFKRIKHKLNSMLLYHAIPIPPVQVDDICKNDKEVELLYEEYKNDPSIISTIMYGYEFDERQRILKENNEGKSKNFLFNSILFSRNKIIKYLIFSFIFLASVFLYKPFITHEQRTALLVDKLKLVENVHQFRSITSQDPVLLGIANEVIINLTQQKGRRLTSDDLKEIIDKIRSEYKKNYKSTSFLSIRMPQIKSYIVLCLFATVFSVFSLFRKAIFSNFLLIFYNRYSIDTIKKSADLFSTLEYGFMDYDIHQKAIQNYRALINRIKRPQEKILVGYSTGYLRTKSLSGYLPGTPVYLDLDDLTTNLVVFGGIGTGKTTAVMTPLLLQTMKLKTDKSIVVWDVKNEYAFVKKLAEENGMFVDEITREKTVNVLQNLSKEEFATILQNFAETEYSGSERFWTDSAIRVITDIFHILKLTNQTVSWKNIYLYLSDAEEFASLLEKTNVELSSILKSSILQNYFLLADNTKTSIGATATAIVKPLAETENLSDKEFNFDYLLSRNQLLYIKVTNEEFGQSAKLYRYMLFEKIYNQTLERLSNRELNQDRYMFVFADEIQEIANHLSFRKSAISRASKLSFTVATQSYSQLISTMKQKENADTMLANFRNRVFLQTLDEKTVELIRNNLAETFYFERSVSSSKGTTVGAGGGGGYGETDTYSDIGGSFSTSANFMFFTFASKTKTKTTTINEKTELFKRDTIHSLAPTQACAIINNRNSLRKEIIDLNPVYL